MNLRNYLWIGFTEEKRLDIDLILCYTLSKRKQNNQNVVAKYRPTTNWRIKMSISMVENLSEPVQHLYFAALDILEDFDSFGEVLQSNEFGEYCEETAIGKLRMALTEMQG